MLKPLFLASFLLLTVVAVSAQTAAPQTTPKSTSRVDCMDVPHELGDMKPFDKCMAEQHQLFLERIGLADSNGKLKETRATRNRCYTCNDSYRYDRFYDYPYWYWYRVPYPVYVPRLRFYTPYRSRYLRRF